jgi:hypothetical protein
MLSVIYGHMYFEQVGSIVDGKWRLRKLAPRMPQTIRQINVNDVGDLVSVQQWAPVGWNMSRTSPGYWEGPEVPVDNLVPVHLPGGGSMSWTGRSMMRDCYRDWLIKDRDLRVEAMNHERAGGVPYAEGAQGMTSDELEDLNTLMQQFRIGENSGLAVPFGTNSADCQGIRQRHRPDDQASGREHGAPIPATASQPGPRRAHVGSYAL